jgi:hypothetical protein
LLRTFLLQGIYMRRSDVAPHVRLSTLQNKNFKKI